jgi:hypothetical protein
MLNETGYAEQIDSYRPATNSPSSLAASLAIGTSPIAKAPLGPGTAAISAIEMRISRLSPLLQSGSRYLPYAEESKQ